MQISQSDVVRVRRRRWRVLDVRSYERCQILTVLPVGDVEPSDDGLERRFVAPFDVVERIERRSRPVRVPRRLWRRACRALIAANTPPGALKLARLAQIDLLPHQLEPALAFVRGLGSRVLLADDVGLGKTIQAGLIVSELRALGAADRVLIITPAGLRDQWVHELSERFHIDAAVLDVRALRRSIATLPVGQNPWKTVPIAITSIDYVKRVEVLAAAGACLWDIVVVDEAHGVAGDSDRHAAVAALASQAAYVVLLTATPHSGDRRAFASLCGIGTKPGDNLMVFRRSRQSLPFGPARRIHRLQVQLSRDEARMHVLLARFSRAVRQQHGPAHSKSDFWLALSVLHKRALSSARSLQQSINRRLAALASPEDPIASQLQLPLGDLAGELTSADQDPGWSPLLSLDDAARERELLGALAGAATRAAQHETKIAALARLLRRVNEPAIVFTEYRDTLMHVQACLGRPAATLHGGMTRAERFAAIREFTSGSRLLLATDAAGEGLNLQQTCRFVINLELPWNPMRLEQRIGRVDRIGQRRSVHVVHLIARGSGESQVLSRLQSRVARARADIGGANPLGPDSPVSDVEDAGNPENPGKNIESAIAQWVIAGEAPEISRVHPLETAQSAGTNWTPSLESDAHAEAERIAMTRTLEKSGDTQALDRLEALGPSVSTARSWRTRTVLGGRMVMLWQIAASDASGRVAGSTIVPVIVPDGTRIDDEDVLERVNRAADAWREQAAITHQAFIGTRLAREHAVDAGQVLSRSQLDAARSTALFQPGLFERRGERAHSAVVANRDATDHDRIEKMAAFKRALAIAFLPPRLLLMLTR
jgi:superfamily II DNA or RNA helicase